MKKFMGSASLPNSPSIVHCTSRTVVDQNLLLLPATLLSRIEQVSKCEVEGNFTLHYTKANKFFNPFILLNGLEVNLFLNTKGDFYAQTN